MTAPSTLPERPVLVTGGGGFIGQRLVHALTARGCDVRPAQPTGQTIGGQDPHPARNDGAGRHDGCIGNLHGIACVFHLAARVHLLHDDAADPLAAYRAVNTASTLRLAEQAAGAGVRRFIFASTAKVHGETTPPGEPFAETMAPAPKDPYALSKWEAEKGLAAIAARTGMEVVVVRPPLVYGPKVKANFAALMRAVARGWPLPLAAIDNRRSLVGLDNLVDFLLLCLEHPAAANQTFLVSDGEDLSTPELLRRLGRAMDRPARLWPLPPTLLTAGAALLGRRAATERLCGSLQVNITKARTLLNWSPPVSVDEGLRRATAGLKP